MPEISRAKLFGKLNPVAYKSMEAATTFCKLRGNPYVEVVHWLNQVVALADADLQHLITHFQLDRSRLAADLTRALDALPRGATAILDFSTPLQLAVKEGWLYASMLFGSGAVRTGHLVVAMLKERDLTAQFLNISAEFRKIKIDELVGDYAAITAGSPEERQAASDGSHLAGGAEPGEASGAIAPAALGKGEALKKFCENLTQKAQDGKIDPVRGRDNEIRQIVDILMRRRQNNPILTGEAGVGKTAVVEGFALRVAAGDVPPPLKDVQLYSLDLGLLQAGASMKGEFENRLKQVIEEVKSSPTPIILFIDEAHTLIGAGGAAGQNDAANLLKPALARGELRTIAATTWAEYKKYFEKDPALTRRFQNILVEEPDDEKAVAMMRGMCGVLREHHKVEVLDEALTAAVSLSRRYIPARQLPDKSVSVLDTACARVAISRYAEPAPVESSRRRIENMAVEIGILQREDAAGLDHAATLTKLTAALDAEKTRFAELDKAWKDELGLVEKILEKRAGLLPAAAKKDAGDAVAADASAAPVAADNNDDRAATLAELRELETQLAAKQGEAPLVLPFVNRDAIAAVIADWTGIPVGRMMKDQIAQVLDLPNLLKKRVVGQDHALDAIAKRIQTARANLEAPEKPIGVFMFAGMSGTGKTETALTLAEALYGDERNLITINMSEFQEAHTVSTLKGAPPGYVGYGEGGVLTEAVRRKPYSVLLLDEMEKAHPDVHEIFFQVFDKGQMKDGEGREINFRNCVIIMTSNVGSETVRRLCRDAENLPAVETLAEAMRPDLLQAFPAALLGRIVVVPYYPLSATVMRNIIDLKLGAVKKRITANYGIELAVTDAVYELIRERCNEVESGARVVDAIITNTLLPEISREFLTALLENRPVKAAAVEVEGGNFTYKFE
ncbi:MAG: type VI secretion system ATPase TssH [Planctomycetota bacterium]|jgi:type VI secretion system protein VasG|nr:type VI secretion system ATPase TssH [Planctomycetota bacterium]